MLQAMSHLPPSLYNVFLTGMLQVPKCLFTCSLVHATNSHGLPPSWSMHKCPCLDTSLVHTASTMTCHHSGSCYKCPCFVNSLGHATSTMACHHFGTCYRCPCFMTPPWSMLHVTMFCHQLGLCYKFPWFAVTLGQPTSNHIWPPPWSILQITMFCQLHLPMLQVTMSYPELQIRGVLEHNSKIIFLPNENIRCDPSLELSQ